MIKFIMSRSVIQFLQLQNLYSLFVSNNLSARSVISSMWYILWFLNILAIERSLCWFTLGPTPMAIMTSICVTETRYEATISESHTYMSVTLALQLYQVMSSYDVLSA